MDLVTCQDTNPGSWGFDCKVSWEFLFCSLSLSLPLSRLCDQRIQSTWLVSLQALISGVLRSHVHFMDDELNTKSANRFDVSSSNY